MHGDITNTTTDDKLIVVKVSAGPMACSARTTNCAPHWLIDSDCGIHMTSNILLFKDYEEWNGGAAQVGDGDKCRAAGRGQLKPIIVRNHSTGQPVLIHTKQKAWHVPSLVFDILSVPMLNRDRIQVNFGAWNESNVPGNYLRDYTTGAVIKITINGGIYVMKTINPAQVPAPLKMEAAAAGEAELSSGVAEGIMPRRHHNIPLWFVLGKEEAPACTVAITAGKRTGNSVKTPTQVAAVLEANGCGVGTSIEAAHPHDWYQNDQWMDDEEIQDAQQICAAMLGKAPMPKTRWRNKRAKAVKQACMHPLCENPACVSTICAVNKSSINRTSPYYKAKSNYYLQHARWGDAPYKRLREMCKHNRIHGVDFGDKPPPQCACRICDLCKNHRSPIAPVAKTQDRVEYEDKQETASMDHIGKFRVRSKPGAHTGAHILTHYGCRKGSKKEPTRFALTYPVRRKSQAPECVRHAHHFIKSRFGRHIRHIQFDNALEYKGSEMRQCMRDLNWYPSYAPKYTPIQNRNAEKTNHLICTIALCMMTRAQAPLWAWGMALMYATYVYNRLGKTGGGKSPYELISGVIPGGSMLRVFWCPCNPLFFREQGRTHLHTTSVGTVNTPCRFAGLDIENENSWLYYDPQRQKLDHNAHMTFDESLYDGSRIIFGEHAPEVTEGLWDQYVDGLGLNYADGVAADDAAGGEDSGDDDDDETAPSNTTPPPTETEDDSVTPDGGGDATPQRPDQPDDANQTGHRYPQRGRRPATQEWEPSHNNGSYKTPEDQTDPERNGEEDAEVGRDWTAPYSPARTEDFEAAERVVVAEMVATAIEQVQQKSALEEARKYVDEAIAAVPRHLPFVLTWSEGDQLQADRRSS